MTRHLLVLLLVAWPSVASAATYYVDPLGNDTTGDGSSGNPWLTIQKGVDNATTAGDIVCVNDGTYQGKVVMEVYSGSDGNPITVRNCEGGEVVVTTAVVQTGWDATGESANIYHSTGSSGVNVSSVVLHMWKDTTPLVYIADEGDLNAEGEFFFDAGNDRFKIYTTGTPGTFTYRAVSNVTGDGFVVRKVSWIVVDGLSVFYNYHGIGVGTSSEVGTAGGTTDNVIQNVTVRHGANFGAFGNHSVKFPTYRTTWTNLVIDDVIPDGDHLSTVDGHCFKMAGLISTVTGFDTVIEDSTISNCAWHGFQTSAGWDGITIRNTTISNPGKGGLHSSAYGIRCGTTDGCYALNNTIMGDGDMVNGIALEQDVEEAILAGNIITGATNHCIQAGDGDSVLIYNNICHDNGGKGINVGTTNTTIYNNTLINHGAHGIVVALDGEIVEMENNIVYANAGQFALDLTTGAAAVASAESNLYFSSAGTDVIRVSGAGFTLAEFQAANPSLDTNSTEADPLFTNLAGDVYTLEVGSPGRLTGTVRTDVFTDDITGAVRGTIWNRGAYEDGNEVTITGVLLQGVQVN